MVKTVFVAASFAALTFSLPAFAAPASCSSANLTKAESAVDAMADGPARWAAFHEISAAQEDMLAGKMRGCATHVGKAMQIGASKPAGM